MALYRAWKEFQATHLAEYLLSAAAVQAAFLLLRHPKTNYGTIPKGADRNPSLVCFWFDQYRYRLSVVSVTDFSNFLRRGRGVDGRRGFRTERLINFSHLTMKSRTANDSNDQCPGNHKHPLYAPLDG